MTIKTLIECIKMQPENVSFEQVMNVISEQYSYRPAAFSNGLGNDLFVNQAGENEGSCQIFAFAKMNALTEKETLACFGKYYREDVLQHKDACDHANIRTFVKHGWKGVQFETPALTENG